MAKFDHLFIEPSDFDVSEKFYTEVMGFETLERFGGDGSSKFGMFKSPGGMLLVMAEHHENKGDNAKEEGIQGNQPTIHVTVDDVDAFYESLEDKSSVRMPPENNHWGTRWFVMEDPDGNLYAYESAASS